LVAHQPAVGGVNPFGCEALGAVGEWRLPGPYVPGGGLMAVRVAAADCGTNALRLLVAEVDPGCAWLTEVTRGMEIVRLGQGVDETGLLAPGALARTLTVLREYADVIAASGAQAVRMAAMSATRDADNAADIVRLVRRCSGVAPEVLTGRRRRYCPSPGRPRSAQPALTMALTSQPTSAGSTEFVLSAAAGVRAWPGRGGTPDPPVHAVSVNVGCVRMTERHLHGDPPDRQEIAAATADIDAALDIVAAALPTRQARMLVGLAGSVTTTAAIAMGLSAYDSARIQHTQVREADVHAVRSDLLEVLVSEHDILDGIAWSLAADSGRQEAR
jgi:exopolyphosphatase/guanosine-5'-triphosphate,3'-diphosphate pyrophosphatase